MPFATLAHLCPLRCPSADRGSSPNACPENLIRGAPQPPQRQLCERDRPVFRAPSFQQCSPNDLQSHFPWRSSYLSSWIGTAVIRSCCGSDRVLPLPSRAMSGSGDSWEHVAFPTFPEHVACPTFPEPHEFMPMQLQHNGGLTASLVGASIPSRDRRASGGAGRRRGRSWSPRHVAERPAKELVAWWEEKARGNAPTKHLPHGGLTPLSAGQALATPTSTEEFAQSSG